MMSSVTGAGLIGSHGLSTCIVCQVNVRHLVLGLELDFTDLAVAFSEEVSQVRGKCLGGDSL